MKLTDLNPRFERSSSNGWEYLTFDCPKCGDVPLREYGIKHSFVLPISPDDPKHWTLHDRNFEALTLTPSVLDIGKCNAHFFITHGEIVAC